MLVASAVLLAAFVAIESRAAHPLLPLRVVRDRTRGGAYLSLGLAASALFAVFLFLTYYLQRTKGYTPDRGRARVPAARRRGHLGRDGGQPGAAPPLGSRWLLTAGMSLGAAGMAWFAQLAPDSSYAGHVLPALLVTGVGAGSVFSASFATATYGVGAQDTGVASAMINTMQQVGGSLGTAALSAVGAHAAASYAAGERATPEPMGEAAVHGYATAFWVAAGIFALGAVLVGGLIRPVRIGAGELRLQPA